jgi:pimeloyl-ACP methyl ester carboxylesterase
MIYAYEEHGGGEPLILLHGGIGSSEMFAPLIPQLAGRRVIAVDLQGHGRTPDADRPLRPELMADDIAELIAELGLGQTDLLGYSLGGEVALRTAIQHGALIRRLVLVSIPFARDGNFPEVLAAMDAMSADAADMMRASPAYAHYERVAPRNEWRTLVAKTAELLKVGYDWGDELAGLPRTLLVYADADSVRPGHMAEFFNRLGGGLRDAGWDGSAQPANQLAILPGRTHYDMLESPLLAPAVEGFLAAS